MSINLLNHLEGVPIPIMTRESLEKLKVFNLRSDDIILSSYPRSGSTWVRHILRLLRNGGRDNGESLDVAVPWLEAVNSEIRKVFKLPPTTVEELPSPRMFKVHLPYELTPGGFPHTTKVKYIYLARNPKDTSVSEWYFSQTQLKKFIGVESRSWDKFLGEFLEQKGVTGAFGGWLNHVIGWWKHRDESNILFLKYEDLKKEPHKTIVKIAKFIGIEPLTNELVERVVEESTFFNMSKNKAVNNVKREGASFTIEYLRKGVVGDWKNYYTEEQSKNFDKTIGKTLKENGLEFE